ncbi:MAG: cupin domain-containing protein [Pseudomonadaceae bacterium]|nr:cupin domain-containing protein [Pseudomonadaceae bacterium]
MNGNFLEPAAAHHSDADWIASPMAGVHRHPLDRIGAEVARATSIVRYAPGSAFSPHVHTGGEEFLVLEGVFQDEHGDYPAGTYVRNPPQSSHTPGAEPGCVIFVKLWQFEPSDRTFVRTDINKIPAMPDPTRAGVSVAGLFDDGREHVSIEHWSANSIVTLSADFGIELFVINGSFEFSDDAFENWSWLRLPEGGSASVTTGERGARVWIKRNHLRFAGEEATRVLDAVG